MFKQFKPKKLILAALLLVLIVTGCASPTPTPKPATAAPATAAPATAAPATAAPATAAPAAAEVNMWTYYGDTGPAAACVKTAGEDFNAAQSQYVLKIRNLAFTDFNQQVTTAIAGGVTPDLMIVDNPDNAKYAAAGALADLTDYVKAWGQGDQFLPGPWNSTLWDGQELRHPVGKQYRGVVDQYRHGHSRWPGY